VKGAQGQTGNDLRIKAGFRRFTASGEWLKNKHTVYKHLFIRIEEMYPGVSCGRTPRYVSPAFNRTAPIRMHGAVLTFFEGAFNGE
jgi:hypothetical protein